MGMPKFYELFYNERIFTFTDFKNKLGDKYSEQYLRKKIAGFIKSKYIAAVKPGLYYIIPQGQNITEYVVDKFGIASKLTGKSVIKYHSALELHGAAYSNYNTVYVSGSSPFHSFEFQGIQYQFVRSDIEFGIETVLRDGKKISVTDRERTLIDGIQYLKYSGGIEEYFKSIEMFPEINPKRILRYLQLGGTKTLFNKAGFVLSYYSDKWNIPGSIIDELKKNLTNKIYYLSAKKEKSKLDNRWNLMVPLRLRNLTGEQ